MRWLSRAKSRRTEPIRFSCRFFRLSARSELPRDSGMEVGSQFAKTSDLPQERAYQGWRAYQGSSRGLPCLSPHTSLPYLVSSRGFGFTIVVSKPKIGLFRPTTGPLNSYQSHETMAPENGELRCLLGLALRAMNIAAVSNETSRESIVSASGCTIPGTRGR